MTEKKSKVPDRKVTAGGVAGAAATAIVGIARSLGLEIDVETAMSIVVVVTFLVSYFVPNRK